jgi:hypothetical protein
MEARPLLYVLGGHRAGVKRRTEKMRQREMREREREREISSDR